MSKAKKMYRPTRKWFFVPVTCGLLGFLFALRQYLLMLQKNEPIPWSQAFFDQLPYWFLWAVISPLILWLSRRYPLQRQSWLRGLLVHIPASVLAAATQPLLYILVSRRLTYWSNGQFTPLTSETLSMVMASSLIPGMIFYCGVLAICLAFNYYESYQGELLKASQLRSQLTESQLQTLKMQLHPHFLFNTLHSVTALVLKNENREAVRMINRLSLLLRRALENTDAQEITLEREIEFLELYLEIERVRFADRLTIEMHINPQTLNARVPTLLLQPLVENAMRHGIAPHSSASRIEIRAERRDGKLCLEVRDDGRGLPEDWSNEMTGTGVGLKNTRARLAQLYDDGYDLRLRNVEGGGVSATLTLPFRAEVEIVGKGREGL